MDLFAHHRNAQVEAEAPLAARMRPRTLDEFIGQDDVVGPGRLLRRAIQADQLSSLIFYGPPGTGKTTLAQIIANTTSAQFIALNAVLAGVKDIREAIAQAQDLRGQFGRRTILFIDEVHRFNKAQQDALLPWVENGTVLLIGATTENPFFEVNKALVSRSRVFQLKSLQRDDLYRVVQQVLDDPVRGYGQQAIHIAEEALTHLVNVANGDARALLNALELAVETTEPDATGQIHIPLSVAEESIQQRAVLYDKEGDAHFDTISAFIKSVRGSDPDAALYWLARMVYAGEDPRYIFRRLVILASEDIGLADPQAVTVATSCAAAFDRVGMPEGRYPLAQATLYLATAPKSNSVMAFFDALSTVEKEQQKDIPNPLRDATRDKHGFGHGKGYLYPHSYREHWVEQQYLPNGLQGQVFYQPSSQGYEQSIQAQVVRRREAQLAAMVEGTSTPTLEALTYSPDDPARDRWLQRTLSQTGERLAQVRDRLFTAVAPQRHHMLLDLNARSGLLTWEAVRRVPEGGVYARVETQKDRVALAEQAALLPELDRPVIVQTALETLADALAQSAVGITFNGVVGRNVFSAIAPTSDLLQFIATLLHPGGHLALMETIPRQTQRLSSLVSGRGMNADLRDRWQAAEASIYTNPADPRFSWDGASLAALCEGAGFSVQWSEETVQSDLFISEKLCDRWFDINNPTSYRNQLSQSLHSKDLKAIEKRLRQKLQSQTVVWQSTQVFLVGGINESQQAS
ncbi:AAA family ATPase [Oscillatoria sp. CS-180]|uniref:AAA family ATPase n=1 Tax=Oscillatoria sp. CS-180 TaxID=3021720 RepID=UPI00232FFAF1|nr:AAA family ATPase [Oscillatoria sp. CS-180]MDB9526864.1 AAA family ATPase [Oscillatoria sp. CS-180]